VVYLRTQKQLIDKTGDYKPVLKTSDTTTDDEVQNVNFEEMITDNNSKYIRSKFKRYKMERLIEVILKAKGFKTYVGPDWKWTILVIG